MPSTGYVYFLSGKVPHSASENGWRVRPNISNSADEKIVPYGENPDKSFQVALKLIQDYCDETVDKDSYSTRVD